MNTIEYLAALEGFIRKLRRLPGGDPDPISENMADLSHALRVGKVDGKIYENEAALNYSPFASSCFYDSGKACENAGISKHVNSIDEKVIVYGVYGIEGEAPWTEDELNGIDALVSLLSSFNAKARLGDLVNKLTFFDGDIGIYNLKQFMRTASMLCRSGQIYEYTAIRFNFNRFSVVNQHIGREKGTLVMKRFIGLVDGLLDDHGELVCRVGGDNFLALVKSEKTDSVIDVLSGTGIAYGDERGERVFITTTIGIYDIKNIGGTILPTDVMDRVSLAFQIAKNAPNTDIMVFNDELLERSKRSNAISAMFPKALEDKEFLVYYQPKVDVEGRYVAGAEALCRWRHEGQLIPPDAFIPVLEQGLDVCKLDFYMLDAVCKDIRRWLDSGLNVVRISVNFSRRHLSDIDLLEHIMEVIDSNNVPHEYIEIELTETTTAVEFKDLKKVINGLQKAGIFTSVDDFGTGYSSLNLIKEMPWNVLKLDKSLLPAVGDDNVLQKNVMFKYIIAMAQEMGLECVSEGVETEEQLRLLQEHKCDQAQGFYFDRPLPVEEFEKRLDKNYVYSR